MTKEEIIDVLRDVMDPEIGESIVDLGMVKEINVDNGLVTINVNLTVQGCPLHETIKEDIKNKVKSIEGVKDVNVNFGVMSDEEKRQLASRLNSQNNNDVGNNVFENTEVIAIGSGKGGVGKSTVTVNLAIALSKLGYNVGLIDADILGFSVSRMMGISGKRPKAIDENNMLPVEAYGIKVISMGTFLEEDTPVIWRGPMLAGALEQFFTNVVWGELDFVLLDLPPGTGDVPLTIMQRLPNSKLVLVTTPQAASSHVAGRLARMAQKTDMELIGIIENMSYFICPNCGEKHYIFGKGATKELADDLDTEIFGSIPLNTDVRENSDEGNPIALQEDHPISKIYMDIAKKLAQKLI